ncbi:MAG TPA: hypothetical protein VLK36_08320 [Gaiellaceae bacterium]|nr:hypothetical protein [Gaiellaceae bacterium]
MTSTALVQRQDETAGARPSHASLSVCCLTGGRFLPRLAAILGLLRPIADEIVVGVDDRARESVGLLGAVADRILLFSHAEPGDRPLAWLVRQCAGDWVFNIDDDEVPSAELVRELRGLTTRSDITHCWVARRWLYPDLTTYLAEPPWSTEYQLRLFRADDRSLAFTDQFHRPVACTGPARFVDAPVWHLDTVLASREQRLRKALRYERARRGMRIGAFSHNTGLYVPELRGELSLELAGVPPRELATIKEVLLAPARRVAGVPVEEPSPTAVEREWPGPPHPPTLYDASISLLGSVPQLIGGVQQTIDLRIENQGDCIWRSGEHAITLGTRWDGVEGIRTSLPADVLPGDSAVVPLHVVPPAEPGRHVLEVDLVHEHNRWFDRSLRLETTVACRRRVLLAGRAAGLQAALDAISLVPEVEPVLLVEPGDVDLGHLRVEGIGCYLFGPSGLDGTNAVPRALRLARRARRRRDGPDGARAFVAALDESGCLIVVDDDVRPGAPPSRDRLRTLTVVAAARARGIPVWRVGSSERADARVDRVLQRAIARRARPVELSALPAALSAERL